MQFSNIDASIFLGCKLKDSREIVKYLQSLPAEDIVKHLWSLSWTVGNKAAPPHIDPHQDYPAGNISPVDLMVRILNTQHQPICQAS